ncbi:MAG: hypothetical protein V1911_00520, partial [Candidatus Micrarchaeota archaeon]
ECKVFLMQKMVQLPLRIEQDLIDSIDHLVKVDPEYRSRSDYIRKNLFEDVKEDRRKLIERTALEIRDIIVKRGAKPGLLTKKERVKMTNEFLRERGWL